MHVSAHLPIGHRVFLVRVLTHNSSRVQLKWRYAHGASKTVDGSTDLRVVFHLLKLPLGMLHEVLDLGTFLLDLRSDLLLLEGVVKFLEDRRQRALVAR